MSGSAGRSAADTLVVLGLLLGNVRESYSARVPRSSVAGVHRKIVHHIVEDEVDGEEERQDDKREDGQQREESGVVEENQTHNMSAWR